MELGPKQKAWIAALRSGKYLQGTNRLKCRYQGQQTYCCLGVACELLVETGEAVCEPADGAQGGSDGFRKPDGTNLWVSHMGELHKAFGLRDTHGSIAAPGVSVARLQEFNDACISTSLTRVNDAGVPFTKIADLLEQFPEFFFTESA